VRSLSRLGTPAEEGSANDMTAQDPPHPGRPAHPAHPGDPGDPEHTGGNRAAWERVAESWVKWARTPGHDAYWYYRDAFFDRVVPAPRGTTLEVGCGEGRVTRDLIARGHRVVAVDGSATLLGYALQSDPTNRYALADATALPFADGSIGLAVAYNSLMDFDDVERAVSEVARVLEPGARFCVCITHPILDGGGFEGKGPDAPYLLRACYFGHTPFEAMVEKRGIVMEFKGWSRSLEEYFAVLFTAGFVIESLHEPRPEARADDQGFDDCEQWNRYPMFLHLRAVKR
jgi:ubiquinone/menaquinone biosynthesis C-methylase UbiE